jgi:hypothetical protein
MAMFGAELSEPVIALARNFLRSTMSKQGSTQDKFPAEYY